MLHRRPMLVWTVLLYTRISGRYAPKIQAPAEGLPSRARKGSLRSLAFASYNIHEARAVMNIFFCDYEIQPHLSF